MSTGKPELPAERLALLYHLSQTFNSSLDLDEVLNRVMDEVIAATQAERGFVTFAPQNLYIFKDRFRTLQRKANPLKKTLFSVIVPQHRQIVRWLGTLPEVDPAAYDSPEAYLDAVYFGHLEGIQIFGFGAAAQAFWA